MMTRVINLGGLNTYINPLLKADGELLSAVNVDSYPYGAKSKRKGYETYLGTADGSAVTDLFSWTKNDGTTKYLYRVSGNKIWSSNQGTGDWTVCGNGTISNSHIGYAVLDNTLILGDGVGSTRHTTNGTAFTNTTLAPIGEYFTQYQNRVYIGGTSSDLFYSTTNDATNWNLSGTSDSSSFKIPGEGKISNVFKVSDRLMACKNSGLIYKWDGYSLVDTATNLSPSSPYSVSQTEGYYMWLNRKGIFGYGGDRPQLLSNPIEREIYNRDGTGIDGNTFGTAPGKHYKYDYLTSVGTVTDSLSGETVNNCVIKYNFQNNEFLNYSYYNKPYSFHSFIDNNGDDIFLFGSANGQVYKAYTGNSDNGQPIESKMEFMLHLGAPELDKEWKEFYGIFNPGCNASVQICVSDTFTNNKKRWIDVGDVVDGICSYRFTTGTRGKLLFVRIYENSSDPAFTCYGFTVDAVPMTH
jgi:hypothetical protein